MRKLLRVFSVLLLAFCVCFALVACVDSGNPDNSNSDTPITDNGTQNGGNDNSGDNSNQDPGDVVTDDFTFTPVYEGDQISGYTLTYAPSSEVVEIPGTYLGYPVIKIAEAVFHRSGAKKIIVPDSVTEIGDRAFSLSYDLEVVEIGVESELRVIGEKAFYECNSLESVSLPDGVTEIGAEAFVGTSVTELNITDSLVKLGKNACDFLINNQKGLVYVGKIAYTFVPPVTATSVDITIADGTLSIADGAFENSEVIKSVHISASVTYIGANAFNGVKNLESITVDSLNSVYKSDGNAIIKTDDNVLLFGSKNTIIPSYVTEIAEDAFNGIGIESVTIPDSVERIGARAFKNAGELVSVTLPSGLTEILAETFMNATKLLEIAIPARVRAISNTAFCYCDGLKTVTIDSAWVFLNANNKYDLGRLIDNAEVVYVRSAGVSASVSTDNGYEEITMSQEIEYLTSIGKNTSNGVIGDYFVLSFDKQGVSSVVGYDEWRRK